MGRLLGSLLIKKDGLAAHRPSPSVGRGGVERQIKEPCLHGATIMVSLLLDCVDVFND